VSFHVPTWALSTAVLCLLGCFVCHTGSSLIQSPSHSLCPLAVPRFPQPSLPLLQGRGPAMQQAWYKAGWLGLWQWQAESSLCLLEISLWSSFLLSRITHLVNSLLLLIISWELKKSPVSQALLNDMLSHKTSIIFHHHTHRGCPCV
jgi:hypothetical protein